MKPIRRSQFFRLFAVSVLLLSVTGRASAKNDNWILINTSQSTVKVMRADNYTLARFDNISLGRSGVAKLHVKGDDTTPLGTFRVISIDTKSAFLLFFGLDYPTIEHAQRAIEQHKISKVQYLAIMNAHFVGKTPPSNTPLGGAIGIHGIGNGSLAIHRKFNWTQGCIALDNEQIKALSSWIKLGTRVVIE